MEHREKEESSRVEGRNPVLEALRSGRSVDKVYISGRTSRRSYSDDFAGGQKEGRHCGLCH